MGIDLFAGAGGMTLAARQAGVEVVFAVERCPKAASTYALNFPDVALHAGDIRRVRELPRKPKGCETVIFGGPPCQGFSTSNQKTRNAENPSNWLFKEFVRLVRLWRPDWVVMENVKGITETEGGLFLRAAIGSLKRADYSAECAVLNAADFGVPQRRNRVFIVGSHHRSGYHFPEPDPTRLTSVSEAIRDLPVLTNGAAADELPYATSTPSGYARKLRGRMQAVTGNLVTCSSSHIVERYRRVPPGGNWRDIPEAMLQNYADVSRCHTGIYRRLDESEPAVVIGNFRKNMLIHPTQHRGLSIREAARLQGVPDRFRFQGSIGFQQQQVSNMVPPALGEAIFRSILDR